MGRQIDLAPTLLAMLGYDEPGEWQGRTALRPGPAALYFSPLRAISLWGSSRAI